MRLRARYVAVWIGCLLASGFASGGEPVPSAREIMHRAFENFYQYDVHQNIAFSVREHGETVLEYQTQMVRKFIDGRASTLFFFTEGDRRDWKILRIEQFDRADDAFVWLPTLRRPRRYPTAQRADKFLGLELTLEDLEVQRLQNYEVVGRSFTSIDGEPTYIVTLQPLRKSTGYDRVDWFIARSDYAMLHARFYRRGAIEPHKYFDAKREWMESYEGHVLPRRMDFTDIQLGSETSIHFAERAVDPPLPKAYFSPLSLEKRLHLTRFRSWDKHVSSPPEEVQ